MKAREIFFEFLDTVLTSIIIAFIVFYFIVGQHFDVAVFIVKTVTPFSVFGLIFIVKFKLNKRQMKRMSVEMSLDEPFVFLARSDNFKDWLAIGILFLVILAIPFFDGSLGAIDFIQALVVLIISGFWHIFLFKNKEKGDLIPVTQFTRLKDEVIIVFIPVAVLMISLWARDLNLLDSLQAVVAGGGMYIWHQYLFNQR
jgi:hypothetical protein